MWEFLRENDSLDGGSPCSESCGECLFELYFPLYYHLRHNSQRFMRIEGIYLFHLMPMLADIFLCRNDIM